MPSYPCIQTTRLASEVAVNLHRYIFVPLIILFVIAAGTLGCDKKDDGTTALMTAGLGCAATQPVTMKSTTYDMSDRSDNYSDDEVTQVSYTLSEIMFGEE